MADQTIRGEEFEKKAEKKLSGSGLFGSKYEDAADLYKKAANCFKLAQNFSEAVEKMKEAKISKLAKKGYDIVKDEPSSNQTRKKQMQYASASATSGPRSTRTDIVVVPSEKSLLGEKWEAFKKKMQDPPIFQHVSGSSCPVVDMGNEIVEDMREQ